MKISRVWLQTYFEKELPGVAELADALTFHAFEIDGMEGDVLDVKITANRGHDCLCHRGIAKELSAILDIPMKADPLKTHASLEPHTDLIAVSIDEPSLCQRFTAAYIRGVKVGPSPQWLADSLESIGQRSINNVVDATNYVMYGLGQPLHAFDAGKLQQKDGRFAFRVRKASAGEKIEALDHKVYELNETMLVVGDGNAGVPAGIAGVKGGLPAAVDETTTDIIIEAANFNGASVRKTAAALKLRTDASARFEQVIAPELAAYGQKEAVRLIMELAGGEIAGFADAYPSPQKIDAVSVTVDKVNSILGTNIPQKEMERALTRLDLAHVSANETITVTPRFERLDLTIPEDLVEEIGRIVGYDSVPETPLPVLETPSPNENFVRAETVRKNLTAEGFSEVYTSVFAEKGDVEVLNKVGGEKPHLRKDLASLQDALARNVRLKDLLGLSEVNLFEIGTVWHKGREELRVATVGEKKKFREVPLADIEPADVSNLPASSTARYAPFSKYPFIARDIAMWTPAGTDPESVLALIRSAAGPLLMRASLFDTFQKGDKTSLAFRLVFQSFERTLTDDEVHAIMHTVTSTLTGRGFEIR